MVISGDLTKVVSISILLVIVILLLIRNYIYTVNTILTLFSAQMWYVASLTTKKCMQLDFSNIQIYITKTRRYPI